MVENVLRYGKLYSKNEFVVLFAGTEKAADSLDQRIRRLNQEFTSGQHFATSPSKPQVQEAGIDIGSIADYQLVHGKTFRVYRLDLEDTPSSAQLADEVISAEMDRHARINKGKLDSKAKLPFFIEAPTPMEAEIRISDERERLAVSYKGNPSLHDEELKYHIQSFFYLAAQSKPANKFVFDK